MRNSLSTIGIVMMLVSFIAVGFLAWDIAGLIHGDIVSIPSIIKETITIVIGLLLGRHLVIKHGDVD